MDEPTPEVALRDIAPRLRAMGVRFARKLGGHDGCGPMYGNGEAFALLSGRPSWDTPELVPTDEHRKELEDVIKEALKPTHAVVCVQLTVEEPKLVSRDTFTGGTYTGECRVFELATGKYLGGMAISADMHSARGKSAEAALSDRMGDEVRWALESALKPFGEVKAPFFGCHW